MRKLYFLLPGTTGKFGGGGLWAELKTCALAKQICAAEVVTYRQREKDCTFLTDILPMTDAQSSIFVIGWGFDIPKLVAKLQGQNQNIIYHAHSAGYGFDLPPEIPIITVSRNTMGYWGQKAANGLIYYLPNQISDEFYNANQPRDIEIVVQTRKSSQYLLQKLIPALQERYRVEVLDSYVEDLAGLFNRSRVYLYDSAEYWATSGVSEGFGLPPLEALACGCTVFSSVNHGLSDFLDPGFNCHKIAGYSLEYDLHRIAQALDRPLDFKLIDSLLAEYRQENLVAKFKVILAEINSFFEMRSPFLLSEECQPATTINSLNTRRINRLKIQKILAKLQQRLTRK